MTKYNFTLLLSIFLLGSTSLFAQTNYYVSQVSGSDSNNGLSSNKPFKTFDKALDFVQPSDNILIMGEYKNENFGDGDVWKTENTLKLNDIHGSYNKYITIKPHNSNTVLKGDAASIIRLVDCSYIRIEGFEIYGEVENISLQTALDYQFLYKDSNGNLKYRVQPSTPASVVENMTFPKLKNISRPTYTDTKGIYVSDSHHIDIVGNEVHHMPGTGLRVAKSDHFTIAENEVHNCSRKSYVGTHALVVHSAKSIDTKNWAKIKIQRNRIHHNYNEIYSWSPSKTKITPHIDEGKGISLQKNSVANGWKNGRILVENNITYWNGFSGLHNNQGDRINFYNNTAYYNSYTASVTYGGNGGGNNIGISTSGGNDIKFFNNIVVTDPDLNGFTISVAGTTNLVISHNITYGNTDPDAAAIEKQELLADPKFVNPTNGNFRLKWNSPAIGYAKKQKAPDDDFYGNTRDANPDNGAAEKIFPSNAKTSFDENIVTTISIFPNPTTDWVTIQGNESELDLETLRIFNSNGQDITSNIELKENHPSNLQLDFSNLNAGLYFIQTPNGIHKILKRD